MKKLLYILILIPIYGILCLNGIYLHMYKSNSFHVRVGCESEGMPFFMKMKLAYDNPVYFTNNNWCTETAIMTTDDISNNWDDGNNVFMQEWLSDGNNQSIAINFAKKLKSYKQCIAYNDSVKLKYIALKAYRDLHKIPQVKQVEEKCCIPVNIK